MHRRAVGVGADLDALALRVDQTGIERDDLVDQLDHAGAAAALRGPVGRLLELRQRVGDGDAVADARAGMRGRSRRRRCRRHCAADRPISSSAAARPVALLMPLGRIITAPLLKMISSSSPSSLISSSATVSCGSQRGDDSASDRQRDDAACLQPLRRTRPTATAPGPAPPSTPACREWRRSRRRSCRRFRVRETPASGRPAHGPSPGSACGRSPSAGQGLPGSPSETMPFVGDRLVVVGRQGMNIHSEFSCNGMAQPADQSAWPGVRSAVRPAPAETLLAGTIPRRRGLTVRRTSGLLLQGRGAARADALANRRCSSRSRRTIPRMNSSLNQWLARCACHGGGERLRARAAHASGCRTHPELQGALRSASARDRCAAPEAGDASASGVRVRPRGIGQSRERAMPRMPMDNDEMLKFATELYVSKYREIADIPRVAHSRRGDWRMRKWRSCARRCSGWKTRWPPGCGSSCRIACPRRLSCDGRERQRLRSAGDTRGQPHVSSLRCTERPR